MGSIATYDLNQAVGELSVMQAELELANCQVCQYQAAQNLVVNAMLLQLGAGAPPTLLGGAGLTWTTREFVSALEKSQIAPSTRSPSIP
jgi:hypothetical protein